MSVEIQDQRAPRLKRLQDALESGTLRRVRREINSLHPAEIADLLESLPPAQREVVWELVAPESDGDVLVELNDEVRSLLVSGMDVEELVAATEGMDLDDLADLMPDLPETVTRQVLQSMDHQDRDRLRTMMAYPEDSAGGLMEPDVVTVRPDVTLEVVQRLIERWANLCRVSAQ